MDFRRPIANEKDQDIHILACIDLSTKYPTVELFDKTIIPNVLKIV